MFSLFHLQGHQVPVQQCQEEMDRELPLVVLEEHACLPVVVIEPDASQETSEIEYGAAPLIPFPIEKKSLMDSVCHSLLLFFSDTISPFSSFDALFILKGFSLKDCISLKYLPCHQFVRGNKRASIYCCEKRHRVQVISHIKPSIYPCLTVQILDQ